MSDWCKMTADIKRCAKNLLKRPKLRSCYLLLTRRKSELVLSLSNQPGLLHGASVRHSTACHTAARICVAISTAPPARTLWASEAITGRTLSMLVSITAGRTMR